MRSLLLGLFLAGAALVLLLPVAAQQAAPPDDTSATQEQHWWRQITTDGYLSLSYTHNQNEPHPAINQFRVFDFNDNEPQLDVAQLVIQRPAANPKQFGFRFDLLAGSGVPEVTAAYGLFRNCRTGIAHHVDLPQFYLRYVIPIGKGLTVDAGKFVTHMGYEVIGGNDGYNDNYGRSFIFGYGIPFTHTGVRTSYAFNNRVNGSVALTKGWDDFRALNHGYTWGTQLNVTTTKNTQVSFNFLHGPERLHNDRDQRSVGEIVAIWKATPLLNLAADALYGHEESGVAPGKDAIWKGIAGYAKYAFTSRWSLAARVERFRDGGGTRTGFDQTLNGITLTPEYARDAKPSKLNKHFKHADGKVVIRSEIRFDLSDHTVFRRGVTGTNDQQSTVAVNLIYLF